jgi:hypothetical protein
MKPADLPSAERSPVSIRLLHSIQSAVPLHPVLADPNVSPNQDGLPGVSEARKIVGALLTFGLIACVAGVVISSIVWALSSHNGNSHYASRGKVGVVVSAGAALLIGGADAIVTFFQGAGSAI